MNTPPDDFWLADFVRSHGGVAGSVHRAAGGALALAASVNLPPPVVAAVRVVPIGRGMAGQAAETKRPFQTCNLKADPSADVRPGARTVAAQAAVALPVLDVHRARSGPSSGSRSRARAKSAPRSCAASATPPPASPESTSRPRTGPRYGPDTRYGISRRPRAPGPRTHRRADRRRASVGDRRSTASPDRSRRCGRSSRGAPGP